MANNFDSNFTRKIARSFLAGFNSKRVMSKSVNTQKLEGKFDPSSGADVDFKRPTDFVSVRTSDGDVSGETESPIITGKATGTVQDYFTAFVDYAEADEAIKMDQLDQLLDPMSTRIVTDLELDFAEFMMVNTALLSGTVGVSAATWPHVARAGATLTTSGVPMDAPWYYAVNPFTQVELSDNQRSLGAGGSAGKAVMSAHEKATIMERYAGFDKVMTANTLASYTNGADTDKAGTLTAAPTLTYVGAKDTMQQVLAVTALNGGVTTTIPAGTTVTVAGRYRLNLATRKPILDASGAKILWSATVIEDTTLTSGAGNVTVTGPGIWETAGAYNTTDTAIASGDVVTFLGSASATIQPNLFWNKNAFGIGSVPIGRLHSTDTFATTADGLQFRVSKGSSFLKNTQQVRIDFRPAYACFNPFFAGQSFGWS